MSLCSSISLTGGGAMHDYETRDGAKIKTVTADLYK